MDGSTEIPQYFLCPISLQIMKEPVTAITGITYDRESIETWLKTSKEPNPTCPVTKQSIPRDSYLTPNHTLQRLIQSWYTSTSTTPQSSSMEYKTLIVQLVKDLAVQEKSARALTKLDELVANRNHAAWMVEVGVIRAIVYVIIRCFRRYESIGIKEAMRILDCVWGLSAKTRLAVKDNQDFVDSLIWCLDWENRVVVKTNVMSILKKTMEVVSPTIQERLDTDFFKGIMEVLKENISQQIVKSALLILIQTCQNQKTRSKIVESNGVFLLIELELEKPEKNISELIFNLLETLCSSAEGRAEFLKHAGSIAMLSKRILRVSAGVDDRGVSILGLISKFSGTHEVLMEMLRVGAVSKLCMVMQADCASYLKDRARKILRLHSNVWNNSPCIAVYLITRYPR